MRKRLVFVIMALVLMLSNCVMLQSERYVQTVRIPLADEQKVEFEERREKAAWEVLAETVSIAQIIGAVGDALEGTIKAFTLPIMGRDTNTIGVVSEYHRFVWWAKDPLPPIPVEAEQIKLMEDIVSATFAEEEEDEI